MTVDPARPGAWDPLREPVFRMLWLAVLVSNIGTWMQTVGAQWLLVDEPQASTLVSLVQTASTLPVVLLALPSGVLADSFDRRRLLIAVQGFQVAVGISLAVLTAVDAMRPPLLLTLTFALGVGAALTAPAYQALIPELVPRSQLPTAAALGAISMNLARAVGPAIAGLLIARVGVAAVFALNAVSFAVFCVVLILWRRAPEEREQARERFGPALRAGGRYVRHSPVVRRILLRVVLFVAPGTAIWALLPIVATQRLELGPSGYGVLLGALGIGAVLGALSLSRMRARFSSNMLLTLASAIYALSMVLLVLVDAVWAVLLALVPAGAGWIGVLSTINATLQLFLPSWVRARGLAVYQIVFFGGQAAGALVWGVAATHLGLVESYLVAAAVMAAGAATLRLWPLYATAHLDQSPASYWPEPQLVLDPEPHDGPVLVTLTFTVRPEDEPAFFEAMERLRRSRQRTGAVRWQLYRDGERAHRFVEAYIVPSWDEHLRQHSGRLTGLDRAAEEKAVALSDPPPEAHHLFPAT
jgi:MFS family permease